jgi:hypothetical protein
VGCRLSVIMRGLDPRIHVLANDGWKRRWRLQIPEWTPA